MAGLPSHLAAVAAIVLVLLATVAAAGAQETGGAISGTILDQQKATLPGVTVTLRNESTNAELTTVTNEQGAFVHPFVPIGRYTRGHNGPPVIKESLEGGAERMADFLRVSVDFGGAAAATTSVTVSHQRSCPLDHVLQIELGNLAPIGQHRRSR